MFIYDLVLICRRCGVEGWIVVHSGDILYYSWVLYCSVLWYGLLWYGVGYCCVARYNVLYFVTVCYGVFWCGVVSKSCFCCDFFFSLYLIFLLSLKWLKCTTSLFQVLGSPVHDYKVFYPHWVKLCHMIWCIIVKKHDFRA